MVLDFIICGTIKGGTTALKYYFSQHPDIFIPKHEICFFANDKNFQKGLERYKSKFLGKTNENVKLIFIMRNPIIGCI